MRGKIFAFLAVVALAHTAFAQAPFASTVNLYITTVNATPTGGTWQVYAQDSNNNDGISEIVLDVIGSGGATVNTPATLDTPRPIDNSGQYADGSGGAMGFNLLLSTGSNQGTGRFNISAFQTSIYGNSDDPTYDMGVLVGVGQEDWSASPQNGTSGPGGPTGIQTPVWTYTPLETVSGGVGAPLYQIAGTLMAQGTYTTTNSQGFLTVDGGGLGAANVLGTADSGMNELWGEPPLQQGDSPLATANPETIALPEPTSLALLGITIALLSRPPRRFSRHAASFT